MLANEMPYRSLSVFHPFYYHYKQNGIAVSSFSFFCLRPLSGWQNYNYTFVVAVYIGMELHLPLTSRIPEVFQVLKIGPNNSRTSSASSVKSLGCKFPGLHYFYMFVFISLCLKSTYIFFNWKIFVLIPQYIQGYKLQSCYESVQ